VIDVRSILVVVEAGEFRRVFLVGRLTADGYEVLTASGPSWVGS